MNPILGSLTRQSRAVVLGVAVLLVALIGVVNGLAPDYSLSIFYLVPITLVAGPVGLRASLAISALAAVPIFITETKGSLAAHEPLLPVWNTAVHFAFFMISSYLLAAVRREMQREERFARQDPTTGAPNRRAFFERLSAEVERARRYRGTFALAVLDLDNFKSVNDRYGHAAGDELLRRLVAGLQTRLRTVDAVARLGGDEFAVVLPETPLEGARAVFEKLLRDFHLEMERAGWPVTFSAGIAVFENPPASAEDALRYADQLMYTVKRAGKGGIVAERWPRPAPGLEPSPTAIGGPTT
jgi:diguanylate cyclase (GGDEF)-like protein